MKNLIVLISLIMISFVLNETDQSCHLTKASKYSDCKDLPVEYETDVCCFASATSTEEKVCVEVEKRYLDRLEEYAKEVEARGGASGLKIVCSDDSDDYSYGSYLSISLLSLIIFLFI